MAAKDSRERTAERRKREREMGMERPDISLHETTLKMLIELVEASGYDVESGEKSRGINGVLTQIIYEVYRRRDTVNLSKRDQQGFILARKLLTLKAKRFKLKKAVEYVRAEKASDYLETEGPEWSRETVIQLIDLYKSDFCPKPSPSKKKTGKSRRKGDSNKEKSA